MTERPAIVWVHGGSFCVRRQDLAGAGRRGEHLRQEGLRERVDQLSPRARRLHRVGADRDLRHRRSRRRWQDAQTAVRFLRTNAATYGIDPTRIAIGGSSAGAITALNVGFSSSEDPTAAVGAAVSLSGARLARHDRFRRRAEPAVPRHGRPDRAVPVGREHRTTRRPPSASTPSSRRGPAPGTCRTCSTAPRSSIRPRTSCTGSSTWRTRRSDRLAFAHPGAVRLPPIGLRARTTVAVECATARRDRAPRRVCLSSSWPRAASGSP